MDSLGTLLGALYLSIATRVLLVPLESLEWGVLAEVQFSRGTPATTAFNELSPLRSRQSDSLATACGRAGGAGGRARASKSLNRGRPASKILLAVPTRTH